MRRQLILKRKFRVQRKNNLINRINETIKTKNKKKTQNFADKRINKLQINATIRSFRVKLVDSKRFLNPTKVAQDTLNKAICFPISSKSKTNCQIESCKKARYNQINTINEEIYTPVAVEEEWHCLVTGRNQKLVYFCTIPKVSLFLRLGGQLTYLHRKHNQRQF